MNFIRKFVDKYEETTNTVKNLPVEKIADSLSSGKLSVIKEGRKVEVEQVDVMDNPVKVTPRYREA